LVVYEQFVDFSKSGIPVVLLVGNHDWLDRTETGHILDPFKEIEGVTVVDEVWSDHIDNIGLSFVPHSRSGFRDGISNLVSKRSLYNLKYNYLFTHQGVSGAKTGPRDVSLKDEFSVSDFRSDFFSLIFNGHFHKVQLMSNNFIIAGSPIQRDFGEREDEKGFWFLDTEVDPLIPSFIKTHAPRFFKIEHKKGQAIKLPGEFSEIDWLWLVSNDVSIINSPVFGPISDRVRFDIVESKEVKLRSDIKISMSIEDQIRKYVELTSTEGLDKELLVEMGVDKWVRSKE
jgi:DNA repair exonuclease SbcCD nuclease subunit